MSANKIQLPKAVAEAIESLRKPDSGFSNYAIIGMLYEPTKHRSFAEIQTIDAHLGQDKMHPDDLMVALVNGFEVEQTPEEKIKEWYEEHGANQLTFSVSRETSKTICTTIYKMLEILNIEISGVNAE